MGHQPFYWRIAIASWIAKYLDDQPLRTRLRSRATVVDHEFVALAHTNRIATVTSTSKFPLWDWWEISAGHPRSFR